MKISQIDEFPKGQPASDKLIPQWNSTTKKFDYVMIGVLLQGSMSEDIYEFTDPAETWIINHGISGYPQVTITNTAGQVILSDVSYDTVNKIITISHGAIFSGRVSIKKIIPE